MKIEDGGLGPAHAGRGNERDVRCDVRLFRTAVFTWEAPPPRQTYASLINVNLYISRYSIDNAINRATGVKIRLYGCRSLEPQVTGAILAMPSISISSIAPSTAQGVEGLNLCAMIFATSWNASETKYRPGSAMILTPCCLAPGKYV